MEEYPKYIVMHAESAFAPLFWDDEDAGIGECDYISIGEDELLLEDLDGLKEWFLQSDKYNPFTDVSTFTTTGMEAWINKGYECALQINKLLPKGIDFYYAYWHQFGDGKWRYCKTYINKEL